MTIEEPKFKENENMKPHNWEYEKLKECFPSYFNSDGSFDFNKFKESLETNNIEISKEGYRLEFLGREYANLLTSMKTETLIEPNKEHNSLPENKNSENMYIVGDNLDVLKHLRESYRNKIKCIYIDPPYNTGSDDFVYSDRFKFTIDDLIEKLSINEEKAERIIKLQGNSSDSAWLTFMYPRLTLARDLLTEDGVIFISIDDNEQANLKILCDEIFGQENCKASFIWRKTHTQTNIGDFARVKEYIICYARNINNCLFNRIPLTNLEEYRYKDENGNKFRRINLIDNTRGRYVYEIKNPNNNIISGKWMKSKEEILKMIENNEVYWAGETPYGKNYLDNMTKKGQIANDFLTIEYGTNQRSTMHLDELMGGRVFDFPKPIELIKHFSILTTNNNDTILDFFSGSATTAHAVMELNAEDGGNRKYIMVQLNEKVKANSEAEKQGYKTIDQIGQERIKRAAKKIKEEHPESNFDSGYKLFSLKDIDIDSIDEIEDFDENPNLFDNNIYEKFGKETLLKTWINYDGYGLLEEPEKIDLKGYIAYRVKDHLYFLEPDFKNESLEELIRLYKEDRDFNPKNIVVFPYNMDYTTIEALNNVGTLKGSEKDLKVHIKKRY